jgi:hypothetical protein
VKEFECKKKHFENQVEELKSKYRKLKGHWNPKRNNSRADRIKELESKEKQFEEQMKEFQSKRGGMNLKGK